MHQNQMLGAQGVDQLQGGGAIVVGLELIGLGGNVRRQYLPLGPQHQPVPGAKTVSIRWDTGKNNVKIFRG